MNNVIIKPTTIESLKRRNLDITIVPYNTTSEEILSLDVSNYIDNAISAFKYSFAVKKVDPLISATILISDYLAIHPFHGHNKKVCWLLFNYLLKFCDFKIAEYMSVEKIISENMETFYKVWEHTMMNWNDNKNDYKEMTKFSMACVILFAVLLAVVLITNSI